MLERLGNMLNQRAKWVLLAAVGTLMVFAALGVQVFPALKTGGFDDPQSESSRAAVLLNKDFGGAPNLVLLVHAKNGNVDDGLVATAGERLATALKQEPDVMNVTSYWATHAAGLKSRDNTSALILAHISVGGKQESQRSKAIIAHYTAIATTGPAISVLAGGYEAANNDIGAQVQKDLAVAESIAIPLTLLLLIVAFGSVVAALLPLAVGVFAIFGSFAVLFVLSRITNVSIYSLNLTTAMGLGLAIDYCLLIVNRYREELDSGHPLGEALVLTVKTAGRTVVFSGGTVAVALAVLLVFPQYFLRSFAYAGIAVVLVAMVGALMVLPALLVIIKYRVNSLKLFHRPPPATISRFWRRLAQAVVRRPVMTGLPVLVVLVVMAAPIAHINFGAPDERALNTGAGSRLVGNVLRSQFATDESGAMSILVTGNSAAAATNTSANSLAAYAGRLSMLADVARVTTNGGTFVHGNLVARTQNALPGKANNVWLVSVVPIGDPADVAAQRLVHDVRSTPIAPGTHAVVGGASAALVDGLHATSSHMLIAIALITLTTFVLLFFFTGSVLLPVKALVLNAVTLSAVLGSMSWIFSEGHLSGLLGFTPTPLDTSMPVLLFCIAFGLSMDYEVFLLSRVKEAHDGGATNDVAVVEGLARTGRIVSTAAALLSVTFFAFATSKVSFIQFFGLGTGLAILLDATLVRGVLVPAFMRLAGRANWWRPKLLDGIYRRFALTEPVSPRD